MPAPARRPASRDTKTLGDARPAFFPMLDTVKATRKAQTRPKEIDTLTGSDGAGININK